MFALCNEISPTCQGHGQLHVTEQTEIISFIFRWDRFTERAVENKYLALFTNKNQNL